MEPTKEHLDIEIIEEVSPPAGDVAVSQKTAPGLRFQRYFTRPGVHPFDEIRWELRTASITGERGEVIFEQKDVEVPEFWSQLATNVVASKYFRGQLGSPQRERSVKQLISRVADTIAAWGRKDGYFATEEDADTFHKELIHLLVMQKASFNSPVWFNVGVPGERPQASACFINSVQDSMESILDLVKTEGMLFKYGSGTGTNFSRLRSSREHLQGGGTASGPVSFMRGFDAFAGVIKSGGKTRRAAKMVILNADHPDILPFIRCKAEEEKKAWALIEAGYDGNFNVPGGAYDSVSYQNANHSVRVSDAFMEAAIKGLPWQTRYITTGEVADTYNARELLREIAEATWICGDPGLQYDDTINRWHTCKNTDRIYASNPCSEFVFLDDTSCNLASLNLMAFRKPDGEFDIEAFRHAVRIMITAQEIIVDNAAYPTPRITQNSHDYRPLGLGYANLGALLMARGLPYDSDAGRAYAAVITAIMTGEAYAQSAVIARDCGGPFPGYARNREPMLEVIRMHRAHVDKIEAKETVPPEMFRTAIECWDNALSLGEQYGYRNAQVTVLAPTGTIAFMMDCDTTGVEPDIALVKYKTLVGGGMMKIVNRTVPEALQRLGYSQEQIEDIMGYIERTDTIEGAPHLKPEHLPVFDCAFKPANGQRSIHYMGHIKMMGAVQPFLSGAISKTVNMPNDATVEDIMEAYIEAWKLGVKAIAIYRDGSKRTQPLSTKKTSEQLEKQPVQEARPVRRKLPDERQSITHKFSVGGHEGYITVGLYPDGTPGEIFITMSKEGSVVSGLMDSFATAISLALQYGVPLETLVNKFAHMRFEPSGVTNNPQIRFAKSIMDYIFRWLALKFLPPEQQPAGEQASIENHTGLSQKATEPAKTLREAEQMVFQFQADAPPCPDCGSIMVRNGACYKCLNCGATSGCS
ncbi:MAG: vitamin B12-dependent ribonucleotide reductase [Chthonomonadetes bacterium]|nr:vitamin B12-dependent ribonucleotide reductase [Chthonomonadetes bacterium]